MMIKDAINLCSIGVSVACFPCMACDCGCGCGPNEMIFEDVPEEYFLEIEAIEDFISYYEKNGLCGPEYLDLLYRAMGIYAKIDLKKGVETYKKVEKVDPNFALVAECEDGSYMITNIAPEHITEQFKERFSLNMVRFGVCERAEDVTYTDQGIFVNPTACKKKVTTKSSKEWCQDNCDTLAFGLGFSCSRLGHPICTATCLTTVEVLRRVCRTCCADEGFKNRCLWALEDYAVRDCEIGWE